MNASTTPAVTSAVRSATCPGKRRRPGMLRARQRGLGLWGYVGLLLLIGAVVTLGLRLGPHYMTYGAVKDILDSLSSERVHTMDKRAIRDLIAKRFKINSLYDLEPKKIISIDRTRERTKLVLDYEVREPIVMNVDAMLRFHDELQFQ